MSISSSSVDTLSRRERQIMDEIYRLGEANVGQVRESLPDPPSYSTIRALMGTLEKKGHLTHRREGTKYVYTPCVPREEASRSALRRLIDSFFGGSSAKAAAALLEEQPPSDKELAELRTLIEKAEGEGR